MSRFKSFTSRVTQSLSEEVDFKLEEIANEYKNDLKNKLDVPPERSGETYHYKERKYTASAPGEPPAPRSGKLRDSVRVTKRGAFLFAKYSVWSPLKRAIWLEEGTSNMDARPAWRETFKENEAKYRQMLDEGTWF